MPLLVCTLPAIEEPEWPELLPDFIAGGELRRRQLSFDCPQIFLQLLHGARTHDHGGNAGMTQYPRQGENAFQYPFRLYGRPYLCRARSKEIPFSGKTYRESGSWRFCVEHPPQISDLFLDLLYQLLHRLAQCLCVGRLILVGVGVHASPFGGDIGSHGAVCLAPGRPEAFDQLLFLD